MISAESTTIEDDTIIQTTDEVKKSKVFFIR